MIRNYLKIAWRNLTKNRRQSLIHIVGLATGVGAFVLFSMFAGYELTYDRHHVNFERIARITTDLKAPEGDFSFATTPFPLADAVVKDFPEIETATRLESFPVAVRYKGELVSEPGFYKADQSVFSVFSFVIIAGSQERALTESQSVILTKRLAEKYFSSYADAVGKTLVCDSNPLKVTAVIDDLPGNSDLRMEGLLSADFSEVTSWMEGDFPVYTFALFKKQTNLSHFGEKLNSLAERYLQQELNLADAEDYHAGFSIEPLAEVHFSKGKLMDTPKGNKLFSYIFVVLALFILVIALLNYINLATAGASERAKEVGVRKVSGAGKFQLAIQFVTESFLLMGLAWGLAFLLALVSVPYFNRLLDIHLTFDWRWEYLLALAGLFVVTTVLTSLYPAFILAGYNPVKVLKGNRSPRIEGVTLRKSIVVVQFVVTIALMAGTLIVYRQVKHITDADESFNLERVVSVRLPAEEERRSKVTSFYTALRNQSEVTALTSGNGVRGEDVMLATTIGWNEGKQRHLFCNYFFIDQEFIPFFKISLLEGRNLSDSLQTDKEEAFIVNQAFVRTMGWSDPIGQSLEGFNRKGKVVGVVGDFHYKSMHNLVEPLVMIYRTESPWFFSLKISHDNLSKVKALWHSFFPDDVFDYIFLDEAYAAQYRKDTVTAQLFLCFTLLAIVISGLGLYGLVALTIASRTREIGVRKVLGATVSGIVAMLSKDFLKLVLIAVVIASPLAWWAMTEWLENFAYQIAIQWWVFAIAGFGVILIALFTVSWQTIKAALANPVESLRNE